jgi:anti-sigma factor RsiW
MRRRCDTPGSLARVSASLTRCDACARDTETTADGRCHYCGQLKPVIAEPLDGESVDGEPVAAAPTGLWEDMRPQLVAAALSLLIAIVGLLAGSTLLLVVAAAVLVAAAVSKIVADGW